MTPVRFSLLFTTEAKRQLANLERNPSQEKRLRIVRKTLGLMERDLHHPSLKTHKYRSLQGPNGEDVFEAYVQQKTPGAYRVFWCYGPKRQQLTIIAITPHP